MAPPRDAASRLRTSITAVRCAASGPPKLPNQQRGDQQDASDNRQHRSFRVGDAFEFCQRLAHIGEAILAVFGSALV
jgi:hypothetical protein